MAKVTIQLDQKEIYSGSQAPKRNSIVIDPASLDKGEHQLTIIAMDSASVVAESSIYLNVGVQVKR